MDSRDAADGLGSLTQAARSKQLNSARTILIAIGILTVLVNGIFVFLAKQMVDDQFEQELSDLRQQGMVVDESKVEELRSGAIKATKLINGVGLAIGVAFIVLGVNVKKYPVPMTITGLVLYLGSAAVFGLMDPTTLAKGFIIKILIIVGLFKAVQAAIAY
ncbi:MAG: hypothetical protein ACR2NM_07225, partial [Bythopirellula sp.]